MASPRMLARRAEMAALGPTPVYLNRPRQPRTMAPGEYAGLLRQAGRIANRRQAERVAAVNAADRDGQPRTIPTGGAKRRRAKANRNRAAAGPVG